MFSMNTTARSNPLAARGRVVVFQPPPSVAVATVVFRFKFYLIGVCKFVPKRFDADAGNVFTRL